MTTAFDSLPLLGPRAPFPLARPAHPLERRWLHYAFISSDGALSVVANLSDLGAQDGSDPVTASVLLLHERGQGFVCSEWNATSNEAPWSPFGAPRESGSLIMASVKGDPELNLHVHDAATPCLTQTFVFSDHSYFRWQPVVGVRADGIFNNGKTPAKRARFWGYHERVRGRWGWPELGGWIFGFCNAKSETDGPPPWSLVFGTIHPASSPMDHGAHLFVWKRGRLRRLFSRRNLRVSVAGQLDRRRVATFPFLASLLGTPPMAPIPAALGIRGDDGQDRVLMHFLVDEAVRLPVPSETGPRPYSVHQVVGTVSVDLQIGGEQAQFEAPAIIEFSGGSSGVGAHVY